MILIEVCSHKAFLLTLSLFRGGAGRTPAGTDSIQAKAGDLMWLKTKWKWK